MKSPRRKVNPSPTKQTHQKKAFFTDTETEKSEVEKKQAAPSTGGEHEGANRMKSFRLRTVTTLLMLGGFAFIVSLGHSYCGCLVFFITFLLFREIVRLRRNDAKEFNFPHLYLVNWYFFGVTLFFIYPMFFSAHLHLSQQLLNVLQRTPFLVLYEYHKLISFMLWVGGLLLFVLTLERGMYKYQFGQFGWTILTLLLVVTQTSSIVYNIYNGLFWFIMPSMCVISNDIFAYIFGFFFGRTRLIKLSPKKTWEGFIGGGFSTLLFSAFLTYLLSHFEVFYCPQNEISFQPFAFPSCEKPAIFEFHSYSVGGLFNIWLSKAQMHSFIISLFASLIAPFGGFFASGLKRAFKIKDFGDSIPGHGGLTDRFDCQMMMGMFVAVYCLQIVFQRTTSVREVLKMVAKLPLHDQQLVLSELTALLR